MATLMLPCFAISAGNSTAMAAAAAVQARTVARRTLITNFASSDHRGKKGSGANLARGAEDFRCWSGFHDGTVVHIDDGISDLAREAEFVRHHHHRHAAAGKLLHDRQYLADQFGI